MSSSQSGSPRFQVFEETHPTNPPRHAGWIVADTQDHRRFVKAFVEKAEAEAHAASLNEESR